MKQDEITEMAREASASMLHGGEYTLVGNTAIERFAALVAAAEFAKREWNFCPRCGKRTADPATIHTCTPPEIDPNQWAFDNGLEST